jgi:hypothetical protein
MLMSLSYASQGLPDRGSGNQVTKIYSIGRLGGENAKSLFKGRNHDRITTEAIWLLNSK